MKANKLGVNFMKDLRPLVATGSKIFIFLSLVVKWAKMIQDMWSMVLFSKELVSLNKILAKIRNSPSTDASIWETRAPRTCGSGSQSREPRWWPGWRWHPASRNQSPWSCCAAPLDTRWRRWCTWRILRLCRSVNCETRDWPQSMNTHVWLFFLFAL